MTQTSVCSIWRQEKEKIISIRKSSKHQRSPLPLLSILAQNIHDLAFNEKEIYSPVLKTWHPLATGVAVATLHACYANELKQFVSGITELTPESIQVLLAAEKLEKDLVEMAVADSVDSEDGGKAIIQELAPYEAEAVIANLVKSWIQTRVDHFGEWVDRSLQQEVLTVKFFFPFICCGFGCIADVTLYPCLKFWITSSSQEAVFVLCIIFCHEFIYGSYTLCMRVHVS